MFLENYKVRNLKSGKINMRTPEFEEIPVGVRLKYLLLSTPTSLKYFTQCLIGIAKGKPIYKRVKVGDKFIGFDGAEYEFIEE